MRINIAIDGPSAAGKSTIAKELCKKLGYVHLDTGAMYRCVSLKATESGISLEDETKLTEMLEHTSIELKSDGSVYLDGKDVSKEIRSDENSLAASNVSKLKKVREDLVLRQQAMAKDKGFIMDGRDIGTVVLKDAELKIYMTASPYARAKRRYDQDVLLGLKPNSIETIAKEIEARDYQDMHRENSPLTKAADAIEIDTSDLTIEEVVEKILGLADARIRGENV